MIDCEKCREMISCLLDNELSDAEQSLVREHIAVCPECRRVYDAFCTISEQMHESEPLPDGLHEKIMNGINAKPKKKTGIVWIKYLSAAACLALVIFAGAKSGILSPDRGLDHAANDMYSVSATAPVCDGIGDEKAENDSYFYNGEQKQASMESITIQDASSADKLTALLEPADKARGDYTPANEPDYSVMLPDGSSVFIYFDDEAVYADFGDGTFLAAGSADDVRALLEK